MQVSSRILAPENIWSFYFPQRLTWYLSSAIAVIDMAETNMLVACRGPIILQIMTLLPNGKCFVRISISVSGIVTVQSNKSATAKLTMNMFRGVLMAGFRTTETIWNKE